MADRSDRWWRRLLGRLPQQPDAIEGGVLELPWRAHWDHVAKRSAGAGFSGAEYREARRRASEVARVTLGDDLYALVQAQGYLDVPSRLYPGMTYRLRIGRRIEVLSGNDCTPPWPHAYLCINPTYPLPEEEFFAQLYLYVRDREDIVVRVAAPQPWDQALGRTF